MDTLNSFLQMGGYAGFVWPAYGLTAVVMLGLLATSLKTLKSREAALKILQQSRPSRRAARTPAP